jgi:hypothetical protein
MNTEVVDKNRGGTVEEAVKRMEQTRPTPTQEENDRRAMGEDVEKHAEDGSPVQTTHPEPVSAEKQKEARAKSAEQQEQSKPTLTQEENDKHAMGEHIEEHEPDGSPEQDLKPDDRKREKTAQAKPGGAGYETRQARAKKPAAEEHKPAEQ